MEDVESRHALERSQEREAKHRQPIGWHDRLVRRARHPHAFVPPTIASSPWKPMFGESAEASSRSETESLPRLLGD